MLHLIALALPTVALIIIGAIALIVIIIMLSSRHPGPTGINVYDSTEKPKDEDSVPDDASQEDSSAADDEMASSE